MISKAPVNAGERLLDFALRFAFKDLLSNYKNERNRNLSLEIQC